MDGTERVPLDHRGIRVHPWASLRRGDRLRRLARLSLLLLGFSCLWSCQRPGSDPSRSSADSEERSPEPGNPRRIISLSPNPTDILEGVGAFDRVVAVSDYCFYPPSVASLPRVGGWQNASLEEVASLAPDLVVMAEVQAPFVDSHLQALGIETLVVPSQSLQDVFTAIDAVGRGVGRQQQARRKARFGPFWTGSPPAPGTCPNPRFCAWWTGFREPCAVSMRLPRAATFPV